MSAKILVSKAAAVTLAASVLFGMPNAVAFAQDNPVTAADFPAGPMADNVDWNGVASFFGVQDANSVKGSTTFVLARIAAARGMSVKDLVRDLQRGKPGGGAISAEWLRAQALVAGYTVDKIPAVGAVAHFVTQQKQSYVAYVGAVHDDGFITIEEYSGNTYRTQRVPAAVVTDFIHLAKSSLEPLAPEPTTWLTDAPPSSPGAERDIPADPSLRPHYPVLDVAKFYKVATDEPTLDAKIRQCGTYAEWLAITQYAGISMDEFNSRFFARKDAMGVTTEAGSAGLMDELYSDLGVAVDKRAAVGAIATWDPGDVINGGAPLGPTGHAAAVTRVYRILDSDEEEADRVAQGLFVDGVTMQRLVDRAKASSGPKRTYVLLEDYNGFGNHDGAKSKYGQKLLPADAVKHYIHLAASKLLKPVTPSETIDNFLAEHPKWTEALGAPTGEPDEVANGTAKRKFANGTVVHTIATKGFGLENARLTQEQGEALSTEEAVEKTVPTPTAQERLTKQVAQIGDVLRAVTAKLAGRKPSGDLAAKLKRLGEQFADLQRDLAALPAS